MTSALLDANVLIRLLTRDMPDRADAARDLLLRAADGAVELHMTALTFAEVVWVLERLYDRSKTEIAQVMGKTLHLPGLLVDNADAISTALAMYADLNVDYIDAFQGAEALSRGITAIYSYDRHLDRIAGLKRLEP